MSLEISLCVVAILIGDGDIDQGFGNSLACSVLSGNLAEVEVDRLLVAIVGGELRRERGAIVFEGGNCVNLVAGHISIATRDVVVAVRLGGEGVLALGVPGLTIVERQLDFSRVREHVGTALDRSRSRRLGSSCAVNIIDRNRGAGEIERIDLDIGNLFNVASEVALTGDDRIVLTGVLHFDCGIVVGVAASFHKLDRVVGASLKGLAIDLNAEVKHIAGVGERRIGNVFSVVRVHLEQRCVSKRGALNGDGGGNLAALVVAANSLNGHGVGAGSLDFLHLGAVLGDGHLEIVARGGNRRLALRGNGDGAQIERGAVGGRVSGELVGLAAHRAERAVQRNGASVEQGHGAGGVQKFDAVVLGLVGGCFRREGRCRHHADRENAREGRAHCLLPIKGVFASCHFSSYWNQPIRVFITASLLPSGHLRSYGSLAHRRMPSCSSYSIRSHSRPLQQAARRRYLRSASRKSPSPDVSPTLGAPANVSFLRLACARNTPLPQGRTEPNAATTA